MILLTWEKFDEPEYRVLRTSVFVTLALVSALPIIHFIIQNGLSHSIAKGGLSHLLVVTAAFVHYQGISEMAMHRVKLGSMCPTMAAVTS